MSDYLMHYGRSVNNGAPGVGTGNWRRGIGLKAHRENKIRSLQKKQYKLASKAAKVSSKKLKPLNKEIGKRQDAMTRDMKKYEKGWTKGGRERAGRRVDKNIRKNKDSFVKANIVQADIAMINAKRAVLNAKEQKRVAQYIRRYGQESLYDAGITPSSFRHSSYLMHYGTKGMKWYHRRYQNADGSLTALGRVHYGVGAVRNAAGSASSKIGSAVKSAAGKIQNAKYKSQEKRLEKLNKKLDYESKKAEEKRIREDIKAVKKGKKKDRDIDTLTDAELRERSNRMRLETEYKNEKARLEEASKSSVQKFLEGQGKRAFDRVIDTGVDTAIKTASKELVRHFAGNNMKDVNEAIQNLTKANNQSKPQNQPKQEPKPQNQPKQEPKQEPKPQNQPKQESKPQSQPKKESKQESKSGDDKKKDSDKPQNEAQPKKQSTVSSYEDYRSAKQAAAKKLANQEAAEKAARDAQYESQERFNRRMNAKQVQQSNMDAWRDTPVGSAMRSGAMTSERVAYNRFLQDYSTHGLSQYQIRTATLDQLKYRR